MEVLMTWPRLTHISAYYDKEASQVRDDDVELGRTGCAALSAGAALEARIRLCLDPPPTDYRNPHYV